MPNLKLGKTIEKIMRTKKDEKTKEMIEQDTPSASETSVTSKEVYLKAQPQILEPIMKVSVEGPSEFAGNIFATISQRRGMIVSSVEDGTFARVDAEVPLSEMFGYSTVLRSLTQGKAEFTMEFQKYSRVPRAVAEILVAQHDKEKRAPSSRKRER